MQNKNTNSSNGAKKFTAKSANGSKSKSVEAEAKGKKTATDKTLKKERLWL